MEEEIIEEAVPLKESPAETKTKTVILYKVGENDGERD